MLLLRRNRLVEALREAKLAVYLSPLTARFEQALGEVYHYSERYDEALAAADKALSHDSTYSPPYLLRAAAYAQRRQFDEAEKSLARCNVTGCGEAGRPFLGYVYAAAGKRTEAVRILDSLTAQWRAERRPQALPYGIAQIYVGLGEPQRAIDWLERKELSGIDILYAGVDPVFRSLRSDPRFRRLLSKQGLPEPSPSVAS